MQANLFEAPHNLRFRSHHGTDEDSECYLICQDIWRRLTPAWEWFKFGQRSLVDSTLVIDRVRVLKHQMRQAVPKSRGARIMIVPKVAVGYTQLEYQGARQDRNHSIVDDAFSKANEMVDWQILPPDNVRAYKFCKLPVSLCSLYLSIHSLNVLITATISAME